ncbi:MAG: T9SS type A sorting domain-containing protein [Bacteroidia bacterium]
MKKHYLPLLCILFVQLSFAQTTRDYAVELRSDFNRSNQELKIYWPKDTSATRYDVYEKQKADYSWTLLNTLGKQDSAYVITGYSQGYNRDFWVKKVRTSDSANGYIHVSYDPYISADDNYGILLLVIDSTYSVPLATEIARLVDDLEKERWEVHTYTAQRSDSVQKIKRWIENEWKADSNRVKSLLLLGHVPVPYSGNFNPDAHPDHQGAWPSDVYYVTFDLSWTDNTVNTTTASRTANHNVPGDNKFDQDYIWPALAKIPMGRVDLYDMPAFGNDTLLMQRYLDKNHAYRTGEMRAEKRAIIDDNFGVFGGEAFAANGWRVFTPMFDTEVYAGDYFSSMRDSSFLFSYGCGGGSYTSAGGIGNSSNFVSDSLLNPFTMIFGSYFGDWDNSNNFLRAPLASKGWGLASAWAGRPLWMFHHAAINEPIGFAAMQSQNAWPTYEAGYSGTYTHIALMGDPSLRLYMLPPLTSVGVSHDCPSGWNQISWTLDGNEADSVEIWVRSGNNAWQFVGSRLAIDSVNLHQLAPGNYELRVYAMDWVKNPSGFFKVLSHPLEMNFVSYQGSLVNTLINTNYFCDGDTLFYSDITTSGIPYERMWYLKGRPLGSQADSFFVFKDSSGFLALDLRIIDSLGCESSYVRMVYPTLPTLFSHLTMEKTDTFPACDSSLNAFELSGATSGIKHLLVYWGDSSAAIDTLATPTFSRTKHFPYAGTYTGRIYGYDASGKCMTQDSFETFVAPNPPPVTISPSNISLAAGSQDFRASYFDANATYIWASTSQLTQFIPGDSVHKVHADFHANYIGLYGISLRVKNQYGCESDTTWAIVNYLASLKDPADQAWQVYPNPSQGLVTVRFDEDTEVLDWNVLSVLGQEMDVRIETVSPGEFVLDLGMLPKGTYLLRARTGVGTHVVRVVRE